MMHQNTGYLSDEEVSALFPTEDRLEKGPVAIIECVQNIPCNPCQEACPRKAILPFERMTDNPVMDIDQCNGCTLCISHCPGLAIYILHLHYSESCSLIKVPYELLPLPLTGEEVDIFDRSGCKVGLGKVVKVHSTRHNPKTWIISVEIPKALYKKARNIKVVQHE